MDQMVQSLPFPIVGIGAAAGGLEALEALFRNVPAEPGMAFVVIQHLSPEHQGLIAQVLARHTRLPVHTVTDGMPVVVDSVYVSAAGVTLTLSDGKLRLGDPAENRGRGGAVDGFLRSLSRERDQRATAVILSGTGTNGTAGAQAIKAAGGLCLVQSPESAAFSGMPESLIHAGCADQVLEPADMPAAIIRFYTHPHAGLHSAASQAGDSLSYDQSDLLALLSLLRARTRHDFSGYRKSTLLRRIQRRMGISGIAHLSDYAGLLRKRSDEVAALANDLMINVTSFFRDPKAWEALLASVIDPLCESKREGEPIRAWVTACASGEEAFTLAIGLAETYRIRGVDTPEIKIFATDLAERPLGLARAGVFPMGIEADVPAELLERYFQKDEFSYRVRKQIRDMIVFASHDILRDPPFSRMDLCTCRNLLIYLEPQTQRRVISMLHFALRARGYLFLSPVEGCGHTDQFDVISQRWRIFRKTDVGQSRFSDAAGFAARVKLEERTPVRELEVESAQRSAGVLLLQRALLERYGPPTVVVDRADQIVYFHGATEPFLRQPAGEPTRALLQLVKPFLRVMVRGLLQAAVRENRARTGRMDLPDPSAEASGLEITAAPVIPGRDPEYFLVSFRTVEMNSSSDRSIEPVGPVPDEARVYEELRVLRSDLQHTIEAYEATSEELKASNEEAMSVNEELQSANEELKTSKEELQAINEELTTVNSQLHMKIQQLESSNNDLANLLSSTHIAVLFLDCELRVRRFTPQMTDLMRLIGSDVGRPVTDIALRFSDDNLIADARAVLNDLAPTERTVVSHTSSRYVQRTLPYRTIEGRIEGVVVTFIAVQ